MFSDRSSRYASSSEMSAPRGHYSTSYAETRGRPYSTSSGYGTCTHVDWRACHTSRVWVWNTGNTCEWNTSNHVLSRKSRGQSRGRMTGCELCWFRVALCRVAFNASFRLAIICYRMCLSAVRACCVISRCFRFFVNSLFAPRARNQVSAVLHTSLASSMHMALRCDACP